MSNDPHPTTPLRAVMGLLVIVIFACIMAWAIGHGGALYRGVPVVYLCAAIAFAMQWIAFIPAYVGKTERFYDLTGSLTYLAVIGTALYLTKTYDQRSLVLTTLVGIWTVRLGTFLFRRIRRDGKDRRFDDVKTRALTFLSAWTLQGLWVFLTLAAALAALTAGANVPMGAIEAVGVGLWCTGFSIEVVADQQKSTFRKVAENRGRFIHNGLWSWSRHPNYFGEILLWTGVAVLAIPTLSDWRWAAMISPAFVCILLTRVSGVPLLERRADERWGGQPDYEAYKARTSVLLPRPPRRPRSNRDGWGPRCA